MTYSRFLGTKQFSTSGGVGGRGGGRRCSSTAPWPSSLCAVLVCHPPTVTRQRLTWMVAVVRARTTRKAASCDRAGLASSLSSSEVVSGHAGGKDRPVPWSSAEMRFRRAGRSGSTRWPDTHVVLAQTVLNFQQRSHGWRALGEGRGGGGGACHTHRTTAAHTESYGFITTALN